MVCMSSVVCHVCIRQTENEGQDDEAEDVDAVPAIPMGGIEQGDLSAAPPSEIALSSLERTSSQQT